MSTPISIQTYIQEGIYFIVGKGEFDETNVDTQFDAVRNFVDPLDEKKFVLFDLSEVRYVNSKFIGYVADISNHLEEHGGRLILTGTQKIRDTLEICGIHQIIELFDDISAGKKYFIDSYGAFLKQKEGVMQKQAQESMRENTMDTLTQDSFFGAEATSETSEQTLESSIVADPLMQADQDDEEGPDQQPTAASPGKSDLFGSLASSESGVDEPSASPEPHEMLRPSGQESRGESALGFFSNDETQQINDVLTPDVSTETTDVTVENEDEDQTLGSPLFGKSTPDEEELQDLSQEDASMGFFGDMTSQLDTQTPEVSDTDSKEEEQGDQSVRMFDNERAIQPAIDTNEFGSDAQPESNNGFSFDDTSPQSPEENESTLYEEIPTEPLDNQDMTLEALDKQLEDIKVQVERLQAQGKELFNTRSQFLSRNT